MNQNALPERMSLDEAVRRAGIGEAAESTETFTDSIFEEIKRLAELPSVKYEQCRRAEAKRLNMRASALDKEVKAARPKDDAGNDLGLLEPEPWSEPVDGDDLLERIISAIRSYVVMPDHAAVAAALWAVHSHCFENWRHTPRLSISAPERGCGKSTLLDVLACLVPRALKTENLSTAAMFRVVDGHKPTLLVDEVDSYLIGRNADEELRGALNAGHAKGGRHLRCEGDDNKVRAFRTFAPAALAGIGTLPGTLADRSIRIVLNRRKPTERVRDFRDEQADHLRDLASQMTRWVADHEQGLSEREPEMPAGIHNRAADNWRGLLSIAEVAGGGWPRKTRKAAKVLTESTAGDTESYGVMVLADLRDIFKERTAARLSSATICTALAELEERPWPEYGKSRKPITTRALAKLLAPFEITPISVRDGSSTFKGYKRESLENAFESYLPPDLSVTPSQPFKNKGFGENLSVTPDPNVTDRNRENSSVYMGCDGVTDRKRGNGSHTLFEGDSEEREAIQAIDGEGAICFQCHRPIGPDQETTPVAGRGELHLHCYDDWYDETFLKAH